MKVKYPIEGGRVRVIKVYQRSARKCYEGSLKNKKRCWQLERVERSGEEVELDPRVDYEGERSQPVEETKSIELAEGRLVRISSQMDVNRERKLIDCLKENVGAFAWSVQDMRRIDPDFICHRLLVNPNVKSVVQKKRKFSEERQQIVNQEVEKLRSVGYIREIQYPTWIANVVLVHKSDGKWRMCTDFMNFNKACPKDAYLLPTIDRLVDGVAGCELLSFMDVYSRYNKIRMHPKDIEKTAFRGASSNFCYTVMPFGLKNAEQLIDD